MRAFVLLALVAAAFAWTAPGRAAQSDDCFADFGGSGGNGAWTCNESQSTTVDTQPLDFMCTNETVTGGGRFDIDYHLTIYTQPNGKTVENQEIHDTVHFQATGDVTGNHYEWNATGKQSTSWDFDGDANHDTIIDQIVANGPGGPPAGNKLMVHFTIHQTVDATGTYHLSMENAFVTCGDETDHLHINPSTS